MLVEKDESTINEPTVLHIIDVRFKNSNCISFYDIYRRVDIAYELLLGDEKTFNNYINEC